MKDWNCLIHFLKTLFFPLKFQNLWVLIKKKKFKSKLTEYSAKVSLQFHWINIQVTRRWSIVQMVSWSLSIEWPSFVLMNMGGLLNIRWASLSLGERVRVGLRTSDCSLGTSFYRLFYPCLLDWTFFFLITFLSFSHCCSYFSDFLFMGHSGILCNFP